MFIEHAHGLLTASAKRERQAFRALRKMIRGNRVAINISPLCGDESAHVLQISDRRTCEAQPRPRIFIRLCDASRKLLAPLALAITLLGLSGSQTVAQQSFPDPPSDLTKIYFLSGTNDLAALPFESAITTVNVFQLAVEDKVTRVRINGPNAATTLANQDLRFFAFVADRMDPPPHQLVRLTAGKSDRSLKISVIKGRKGYAPFDEDNVRLQRRTLQRLSVPAGPGRMIFVNYMELRPSQTLPPGEYAIIGDSLADIATFRVK